MGAGIESRAGGLAEPSSISSSLLEQIRARRPEAWQRLVDLYGPTVYRWCRQLGVPGADAADVVQEVFAAVAGYVRQFRRDRPGDSFGAWLRTITRNKVCDCFRGRRQRPHAEGGTDAYRQLLDRPESPDASSLLSNAAIDGRLSSRLEPDRLFTRRALEAVRAEFENPTWEAFWRVTVDGQSPADAAAAMGLSLTAVYKAKSRVLRRLRQELSDSRQ